MRIAITCHYAKLPEDHPTWRRAIETAQVELSEKVNLSGEELLEFIQGADALISGTDFIMPELLDRFPPSLKVISRPAVGYDRVDAVYARKKGIDVCNAPGTNSDSVADLAVGLMVACARGIYPNAADCKAGKWTNGTRGMALTGKTVGVMGMGAIGKRDAQRCQGFGMNVVAYDPYIDAGYCAKNNIRVVEMDELLAVSDVVTLHLPLMPGTENIINSDTIAKMKDGAILINTARGGLVDHDALYEALINGKLRAYGADTTIPEPPPADMPLIQLPNVIITAHIGANTNEALENMMSVALENALDILEGKPCRNIVNK
ncbi:MAG: phosphoglycerate dehydrogenase [Candidatus Heteroscillospira sp.]